MTKSVYQIGYGVSSIVVGILSDKCGRIVALKATVILEIIAGISQSLSLNIYQFLIARFFLGIAAYGRFLTCYLLCKMSNSCLECLLIACFLNPSHLI